MVSLHTLRCIAHCRWCHVIYWKEVCMKARPHSRRRLIGFSIVVLGMIFGSLFLYRAPDSGPPTPERMVTTAWRNTHRAEHFQFETTIDQVTHQAPTVQNAGQPARRDTILLRGT